MTKTNYIPRPPAPWSKPYPWWKPQTVFIHINCTPVIKGQGGI